MNLKKRRPLTFLRRRLHLEVIIHLSEYEKMSSPYFFVKATHRLRLEAIIHLSEFEKLKVNRIFVLIG